MKLVNIPTKYPVLFARDAAPGYINPIPVNPSPTPGKASFSTGFPEVTFQQIAAGGVPPYGADFNGLLNSMTAWLQWQQAGAPLRWDSSFSASIGGYPAGAVVQASTLGNGRYWLSVVDDNLTNPNSGGAGWIAWPDTPIQIQKDNYGVDTGVANQIVVTLGRAPATWAEIVGAPIRVLLANTNNSSTPTIKINALTAAVCVNADGTAIENAQLVAGNIMEGMPRADGKFQVNSPVKPAAAGVTWPIPGYIMPWPTETPPTGFLECNGQTLLISSYPNLFNIIGNRYGGDGVNNFRLPDYRGQFLRGWDHGRGLDPNAGSRANSGGGFTGDRVGTTQSGAVRAADLGTVSLSLLTTPPLLISGNYGPGVSPVYYASGTIEVSSTPMFAISSFSTSATISGGGSETRPVNIYVMWVIKF